MKLDAFRFLTDENIHSDVRDHLRSSGLDIRDVREEGMIGAADTDILRAAQAEARVVVTHDRDFGQLAIASLQPFTGILYLRPGHIDPQFTIETLQAVFARGLDLQPQFIVVAERWATEVKIRVRQM